MIRLVVALIASGFLVSAEAAAQTAPKPPARKPAVAPRATSVRVGVHDSGGAPLSDVHLVLSGAGSGEFTTGPAGTAIVPNLKPGSYRIRAERDGFVTLEREFTLGAGVWNPIDLIMDSAPPPPRPAPEPTPAAPAPIPPSGPPVTVSVPDFLDRNFIGREPIKESILAC